MKNLEYDTMTLNNNNNDTNIIIIKTIRYAIRFSVHLIIIITARTGACVYD